MADSLALTFGSDLSGNSNIATISIASMVYSSMTNYDPSEYLNSSSLSKYRAAWPSGASFALFRPTTFGSTIAIAGAGVISNTTAKSSIAVTRLTVSSTPTSSDVTVYLFSNVNTAITANLSSSLNTNGQAYGGYVIFF